ncbi:MAG: Flp pilus assembly complex ATPase component TadA [Nanoarchaeota archaeon]|nr:Flp pilus assembly complex ATPase component TadA [Nanoarchaeota archaeon]
MIVSKSAYKKRGNMIKDSYSFFSDNIPINISIESNKNEFVLTYKVSISKISENTEIVLDKIRDELVNKVSLGIGEISDPKKMTFIKKKFRDTIIYLISKYFPDISDDTKDFFTTYLMQKSFGLGKVEILLSDNNLEDIVINNADEFIWVYHHRYGWLKTDVLLKDEGIIKHYSSLIGRKVGRSITLLKPLLDAHLDSGDRVNATLFPITTKGNTISIRKFSARPITITDLLNSKVLSLSSAALIWTCVQYELSGLIAGGTGSGKTTFLGAISNFIPPNQRIISIEDTREIQLANHLHWVPMVTREPNTEGKGEVSMLDLVVNSLRMRPDRIIVGEIRKKKEADILFEAMHTGHSVYATLHANDTEETLNRLLNPPIDIPKTLLPAVSMLCIMYRNRRTGIRRMFQFTEILKDSRPNILLQLDLRQDKLLTASRSVRIFPELEIQTGLSEQEINQSLKDKSVVLKWLVKRNVIDVQDVGKVIATYYTNKEGLIKFMNKNV